jgi:hypothetical protein
VVGVSPSVRIVGILFHTHLHTLHVPAFSLYTSFFCKIYHHPHVRVIQIYHHPHGSGAVLQMVAAHILGALGALIACGLVQWKLDGGFAGRVKQLVSTRKAD